MATTPYFLTFNLDEDELISSQSALSKADVLTTIDAAPAGQGYVVCGTGSDVSISNIPLGELASGDLNLGSNEITCRNLVVGNSISAIEDCETVFNGPLSALEGLTVSGDLYVSGGIGSSSGVSSIDDSNDSFYFKRQPSESYANLIRATNGTITIQPEDDVHIKTNSGEDCARFNENAAVWLYYDNAKKIETTTDGAHVSGTLRASASSIQVSTCPVPAPWSYVQMGADDGENTADPYYWASGATQLVTEIDSNKIVWDETNNYFTVADAGFYELIGVGSVTVTSTTTTVVLSIVQTTGLGGVETVKNQQTQVIRVNIDPHLVAINYIGYFDAGVNITCKLDGDSAIRQGRGSSLSCKRIN